MLISVATNLQAKLSYFIHHKKLLLPPAAQGRHVAYLHDHAMAVYFSGGRTGHRKVLFGLYMNNFKMSSKNCKLISVWNSNHLSFYAKSWVFCIRKSYEKESWRKDKIVVARLG